MLCFLYIFLYVKDEVSYDKHSPVAERTYRLNFYAKLGDQVVNSAASPAPSGPTFKNAFPEIETMFRFRSKGRFAVKYGNHIYSEEHIIFADSTLFKVFALKMPIGDPATALKEPNTAVITESTAKKYFGQQNPLGKMLTFDNKNLYQVTGIIKDIPRNTHFHYDFFLSMSSLAESREDRWESTNFQTYFVLKAGTDPSVLSKKITSLFVQKFSPVIKEYLKATWEEFIKAGNYARVEMFPTTKIHLYSALDEELEVNGDIKYVYFISIIGLFILILACINFMNLATARSSIRAKEVGVRKSIGAVRSDLAKQFLSESLLMSLSAWVLALAGLVVLMPFFNNLSGKVLASALVFEPAYLLASLVFASLVGLVAGSYPAFFLSSFNTVKVLKNSLATSPTNNRLRSGLVVFQFIITTILLISTMVIYEQLAFIRNKKIGFSKEQVLVLQEAYLLGNNVKAFKETMLQNKAVKTASVCSALPITSVRNTSSIIKGRNPSATNSIIVNNWWVDYDYIRTMDMKIVEGRDFSREIRADSMGVIINETLARSFGYPHKRVIGLEIGWPEDNGRIDIYPIVGVVKDFNFLSLRQHIEPLAIFIGSYAEFISFRFETTDIPSFISSIESSWQKMAPGQPLVYSFLDQRFDKLYESETRIGKITNTFAFLAIFIACIGLFGLASFAAERRTKEIGIRKVLGASVLSITTLLSKDFLKLVLVAIVIASPIAWYAMDKWLQDFAYRIEIGWWVFMLAGVLAVAIALVTVSYQSIKAALMNPVKSLKTE